MPRQQKIPVETLFQTLEKLGGGSFDTQRLLAIMSDPKNFLSFAHQLQRTSNNLVRRAEEQLNSEYAKLIAQTEKAATIGQYSLAIKALIAAKNLKDVPRQLVDEVVKESLLTATRGYFEENFTSALEILDDVLNLDPGNPAAEGLKVQVDADKIEAQMCTARKAFDQEDYQQAAFVLEEILALEPHTEAQQLLTDTEGAQHVISQYKQAIRTPDLTHKMGLFREVLMTDNPSRPSRVSEVQNTVRGYIAQLLKSEVAFETIAGDIAAGHIQEANDCADALFIVEPNNPKILALKKQIAHLKTLSRICLFKASGKVAPGGSVQLVFFVPEECSITAKALLVQQDTIRINRKGTQLIVEFPAPNRTTAWTLYAQIDTETTMLTGTIEVDKNLIDFTPTNQPPTKMAIGDKLSLVFPALPSGTALSLHWRNPEDQEKIPSDLALGVALPGQPIKVSTTMPKTDMSYVILEVSVTHREKTMTHQWKIHVAGLTDRYNAPTVTMPVVKLDPDNNTAQV